LATKAALELFVCLSFSYACMINSEKKGRSEGNRNSTHKKKRKENKIVVVSAEEEEEREKNE